MQTHVVKLPVHSFHADVNDRGGILLQHRARVIIVLDFISFKFHLNFVF